MARDTIQMQNGMNLSPPGETTAPSSRAGRPASRRWIGGLPKSIGMSLAGLRLPRCARSGWPSPTRALETGLWPSLDVLPEAERAATGQALVSWSQLIGAPGPLDPTQ